MGGEVAGGQLKQPLNHILPNFSLSKKLINLLLSVWQWQRYVKMEQEKTYAARKLLYEGAKRGRAQIRTHTHTAHTHTHLAEEFESVLPLKNESLVCQSSANVTPKKAFARNPKSNVCNLFKFKDSPASTGALHSSRQTQSLEYALVSGNVADPFRCGPLEY